MREGHNTIVFTLQDSILRNRYATRASKQKLNINFNMEHTVSYF